MNNGALAAINPGNPPSRRGRRSRYALGLLYDWRKDITLGVAFEYMDAGSAPVDQQGGNLRGGLKSDFKNDDIYFLALSLNWKF